MEGRKAARDVEAEGLEEGFALSPYLVETADSEAGRRISCDTLLTAAEDRAEPAATISAGGHTRKAGQGLNFHRGMGKNEISDSVPVSSYKLQQARQYYDMNNPREVRLQGKRSHGFLRFSGTSPE